MGYVQPSGHFSLMPPPLAIMCLFWVDRLYRPDFFGDSPSTALTLPSRQGMSMSTQNTDSAAQLLAAQYYDSYVPAVYAFYANLVTLALPIEICVRCFRFLEKSDLGLLTLTCKRFRDKVQPWLFRHLRYSIPHSNNEARQCKELDAHVDKALGFLALSRSPFRQFVLSVVLHGCKEDGERHKRIPSRAPSKFGTPFSVHFVHNSFLKSLLAFPRLQYVVLEEIELLPVTFKIIPRYPLTRLPVIMIAATCRWIGYPQVLLPIEHIVLEGASSQPGPAGSTMQIFQNDSLIGLKVISKSAMASFLDGMIDGGVWPKLAVLTVSSLTAESFPSFVSFLDMCPNLTWLTIQDKCIKNLAYRSDPLHPSIVPNLRAYHGPAQFLEFFLPGRRVMILEAHAMDDPDPSCYPPTDVFFARHFIGILRDFSITAGITYFRPPPVSPFAAQLILWTIATSMRSIQTLFLVVLDQSSGSALAAAGGEAKAGTVNTREPAPKLQGNIDQEEGCTQHVQGKASAETDGPHHQRALIPYLGDIPGIMHSYMALILLLASGRLRLSPTLTSLIVVSSGGEQFSQHWEHTIANKLGCLYPQLTMVKLGSAGDTWFWFRRSPGLPWLRGTLIPDVSK